MEGYFGCVKVHDEFVLQTDITVLRLEQQAIQQKIATQNHEKNAASRRPLALTLSFTELGFGTAPLGNLYRAHSNKDAEVTLEAAWISRHPVF